MPVMIAAFILSYIDRQNVAFAKLQMVSDLGMSEVMYGLGSSLFFIGYIFFDVPSALAVHRYGARIWIARIMLTWGVITLLLAATHSIGMFYTLRFLLGAAEAGFYPGSIYYLTLWFPQRYRMRGLGVFTLGAPLGNLLGSLISGPLLELNGKWGLAGWQWIFIATGIPALLMACALLLWLPDGPATATFITINERERLLSALQRDMPENVSHGNPLAAIWDVKALSLGLIYMLILTSLYGVTYWLPTIVKGFGISSRNNGFLNMIPWTAAIILLLVVTPRVRGERAILRFGLISATFGLISFIASTAITRPAVRFAAICVGAPCVQILLPSFWSLATRFFKGARAASSIAVINAVGLLGGFSAQNLMPWVAKLTGSAVMSMMVPATCLTILALLSLITLWFTRALPTAVEEVL